MTKLRVWDFCSGAGGFSAGFQLASKGHHYTGLEIDPLKAGTYSDNIVGSEIVVADIMQFDPATMGKVDVIIGSPPCPSFSGANVYGDRNRDPSIIKKFLSIVWQAKPRFWAMEESPFARDLVTYPAEVYAWPRFIRACDHGLYHERLRLIAGNYPEVRPTRVVRVIHKTPVAQEKKAFNKNKRHAADARSCCQWFGRRLSTWELQVLMGFPPEYTFRGDYRERCIQIGNAVCPPVSRAIFSTMLGQWHVRSLDEYAAEM
jgi:site-specific DNA-cytosine methylase